MRYSKVCSTFALAAGMALAGASALPAADWQGGYREDLRADSRELRRDAAAVDRLRAEVARDQARLNEDSRHHRWAAVERDRAELIRDQRALDAKLREV